jgi:protein-disulfide isomerase
MTDLPPSPVPEATKPAAVARRPVSLYLSAAALAVSIIALGMTATLNAGGTNDAFGKKVRAYLMQNPQVLDEVVQAREAQSDLVRTSGINEALKANPDLLKADARDPAFGPTDAKVTVIEFFDFRCPGCKAVAPEYRALIAAHPDVRFVFKDWPILDRGDDHTSQYAARAALAAHQQGKYLAVYDGLMSEPSFDQAGVDRILTEAGVDLAKAKAAMVTPEMTRHVTDIHTVAATLGLQGTPTFIINGQAAPSIDPAEVDRMIKAAKG